ncbi:MAG: lamin tail domain-containing protein [Actinomycetota bacterium]|nr:lamin tail domain-containing protein [Actinomycetota bacterium]
MPYTLLRGEFVIRYPDMPRQGPEPDGDTVKFAPDIPALVEGLPRISGRPPDISDRGISVRLEAIDALETHFADTHQELAGANAARDALLAHLGFSNVVFFDDLPNKVQSADADQLRGHVLSNGIDANGRMIGFVYPGDPAGPDGSEVFVDPPLVETSINAKLLAEGHVYPAFYGTLPAELREHLARMSRAARASQAPSGVWSRAVADPNTAARVADLAALETLVIWPKLFRRIVPYFAAGNIGFDGFDAFLRADPVNRDDKLFLLDRLEPGNMHDIVRGMGDEIQLSLFPEDFIIEPDPAPLGGTVSGGARPSAEGDVLIIAALPDPRGADARRESVTLLNNTAATLDLTGWAITDSSAQRQDVSGTLRAEETLVVRLHAVQLDNRGDTLILINREGHVVDQVAYQRNQVRPGRQISFRR